MTGAGAEAGNDLVPTQDAGTREGGHPSPIGPSGSAHSLIRAALAVLLAGLAGWGCVLLLRKGIRTDTFPPFVPGATSTQITRYSGPWLTAAAGAALLAALLLLFAATELLRWNRARTRAGFPPVILLSE